jgi:hypothetical protein
LKLQTRCLGLQDKQVFPVITRSLTKLWIEDLSQTGNIETFKSFLSDATKLNNVYVIDTLEDEASKEVFLGILDVLPQVKTFRLVVKAGDEDRFKFFEKVFARMTVKMKNITYLGIQIRTEAVEQYKKILIAYIRRLPLLSWVKPWCTIDSKIMLQKLKDILPNKLLISLAHDEF